MKRGIMICVIVILGLLLIGLICAAVIPQLGLGRSQPETEPVETQLTEPETPSEEQTEETEEVAQNIDIGTDDIILGETEPEKETHSQKEPTQVPADKPAQKPTQAPSEEPTQAPTEEATESVPTESEHPKDMTPFG